MNVSLKMKVNLKKFSNLDRKNYSTAACYEKPSSSSLFKGIFSFLTSAGASFLSLHSSNNETTERKKGRRKKIHLNVISPSFPLEKLSEEL